MGFSSLIGNGRSLDRRSPFDAAQGRELVERLTLRLGLYKFQEIPGRKRLKPIPIYIGAVRILVSGGELVNGEEFVRPRLAV
jgi:hypothetical protein